jgi:lipid A ethanolaminephosphotransferase
MAWLAAVGVLPALVAWRWPLRRPSRLRVALTGAALLAALVLATGAVVYAQYSRYASASRNRDIGFATVAPANLLAGAVAYGAGAWAAHAVRAPRGVDAHAAYAIPKPRLLVLVLGETARAANQGLNGYARDTTPRMRAAGGYYFRDTESCGTATAISVPCIFSGLSREEFSLARGRQNETLIDVVKRSGARVIWLDNDSGCKDVCNAAEYHDLTGSTDPRFCPEAGECHDAILLDGLEERILAGSEDTLVVLHLKGSHGPAYFRRYPPEFERFAPVCRTSDLSACAPEELVNAYDNSILYTDHIVGESVELLKRVASRYAAALLYVSDHGESLGEAGLYLHGMPWAVAPREQKTVPMFAWVSPEFLRLEGWNPGCMARQAATRRSHDNVYATVLGFMEVESVEYKPDLDLFEPCDPPKHRPPGGPAR